MTHKAETISNDLIAKINGYVEEGVRPTEFEIMRLKREANQLKASHAFESYMILGMISSLTGNYEDAIKNEELALKINPTSWWANINHSISLCRLGKSSDAVEFAEKALDLADDEHVQETREALRAAYLESFQIQKLATFDGDEAFQSFLDSTGIEDEQLKPFSELIYSTAKASEVFIKEINLTVFDKSNDLFLRAEVPINRSPEDAANMNWELSCALAGADIDPTAANSMSVGFIAR